ncbi:hypothetical protein RhiirA1_475266 [Rhizophagus irregularis]|uniref:RNI-like protein n=3 Tax=Rhizophagus irregularis TaxID=588596 RepID=U9SXU9_RHIID|nr:hypothetical protein GLOIN_2v1884114 [Rhizophagus irregularis DAOM 181602=DAOM 197198]EXX74218.1 hypothetical protein RirG_053150 [Rhizophagus irregularis DAOM 197198w]PKC55637.1 hypothetical protein RhiirA1_475266 [Rhizophagus irregularis]POG60723.1 hypothetical protein GLOIN_2v1884114 [Rhizophagus irregularis DAOM 181602=DAOM 197198]UZO05743.1 hypothetical protein OCT59_026084 [Rhizophagus irregularis]CAB4478952.1 unnamed protein product [Rhizophagus irregularis]|eukprot:XP_025167589.1 hypothetical protein GLOIN_2v1884114 [Rhizophagus irregularis DAOM 181602=DAOM 197198]
MSLPILNSDIILEIIKNSKDNTGSLFNFLFVNKYFSKVAVSVLWENPFKYRNLLSRDSQNYSIIQTYINFFNEEECNEINQIFKNINEVFKFNNEQEKSLRFHYGKYLKEFNFQVTRKAIDSWYSIFKEKNNIKNGSSRYNIEECIMKSIMRQCQKLDSLNWGICLVNEGLLKIMQDKIKDLKYFTIDHYYSINYEKSIFGYLKNHCKNISCLTIDDYHDICGDKLTEEFISFIELQNGLNEFILDHAEEEYEYKDLITSTLEFQANNLTKVILNGVDFSDISFDYIDKCINLKVLGLRYNKGLIFDDMDLYTSFKNLKILDLSYNEWSSEVTTLIIKKAGKSLTSLTIGENNIKQAINDDTLIALTNSCPNIRSLSISKTSSESIKMVLSYLKDLKLVTLQLFQIEKKGTVMKSEDLLNYIENEKSLFKLGLGKNDKYWDYYNERRRNFEKFLKKHNVKLIAYKPKNNNVL